MIINLKKLAAVLCCTSLLFSAACDNTASTSSSSEATSTTTAAQTTASATEPVATALKDVTVNGDAFYVDGKEIWFNGANTPWDKWNDFGGEFDESFWSSHFRLLKKAGVNSTRIWFNCNGMIGVQLNQDGSFASVSDKHWADCDKLFEIAAENGIYIMATMLSFDHFKDSNDYYDRWRAMLQDKDKTQSFVDGYVVPFAKRYDSNPALWSIDLMNEPDWVFENSECGKLSWDSLSRYFGLAAAGIHENSDVLVTVGMGMIKYNSDSKGGNKVSDSFLSRLAGTDKAYLDFYSTHYYSWQSQWYGTAYNTSPEDFGLTDGKPCLIGECAALDEQEPVAEKYSNAFDNGWKGFMVWTSNGVDSCGGYADMIKATVPMHENHAELIFPLE